MEREREANFSEFGALLRRYRLGAGLSQDALAERAGMSSAAISALERGQRRRPQRDTLALLAGALALDGEQRREFEAAATRPQSTRRASVFVGPWPDAAESALPLALTRFVGRATELAEIAALVREYRLVTLTGSGGIGKTQTALQMASAMRDTDGATVSFVELGPLGDPSLVANAIAAALGVQELPNHPIIETLIAYLKNKALLLILDNCEHVIDEAASVTYELLLNCPKLRILTTSREALRTAGERAYRLPSLSVAESIELFTDRASAVDADFTLTDATAGSIEEICSRLDGIALAIELAAARVRMLPPRELAKKLDERFRVLTAGSRTAVPRQQTMRALIDWSHDLLSEPQQRLFRRLAVFGGGWTLDSAEAVCTEEGFDSYEVIDLLSSLVDKSLVVAKGQNPRYGFLESTRAFALEKLEQSGEHEALMRRHAEWCGELGNRACETAWTIPLSERHSQFDPEIENACIAIDWARSHNEILLATRILVGFSSAYQRLIGVTEVRNRLEAVLERLDAAAQPAIAARAWHALAEISAGSRRVEAAQRALEFAERCNDPLTTILSLTRIAVGLFQAGRPLEAQQVIDRALQLSKESGLTRSLIHAQALNSAAIIAEACGRVDEAEHTFAEALALATALGDETRVAEIRANIAELEFQKGNVAGALELIKAIEAQTDVLYTRGTRIQTRVNGAAYRIAVGDILGAHSAACDSLLLARGVELAPAAIAMQHLATVAALGGDAHRGARLRGFVDASYRGIGYRREVTEQRTYHILMTALRRQLSDAEIESLAIEGAQLSEDQAVAEATVF